MDEVDARAETDAPTSTAGKTEGAAEVSPDWGPPATRVGALPDRQPSAMPTIAAPTVASGTAAPAAAVSAAAPLWGRTVPPRPTGHTPPSPPGHMPPPPRVADQLEQGPKLTIAPLTLGAAVVAAFFINVGMQTRVNSIVTLVAVTIIAGLAVRSPGGRHPATVAPAALAVAAAAVTVLRASPWVVVPATLTWISCLVVAAQGRLFAGATLGNSFVRYTTDFFASIAAIANTILGAGARSTNRLRIIRGLVIATVVLIPLAALLASADAVFRQLLQRGSQGELFVHAILTAVILPAVAALTIGKRWRPAARAGQIPAAKLSGSMIEGSIILAAVAALLGVWGALQIAVATGGGDRLLATADLTAAENAREGFFELVQVTGLLVLIVVGVHRFVERKTESDDRRFLLLTAIIGVETIGVVIATYSRLDLYIARFGNTMLRTSVAWFLAWLAVVMVVIVVAVNHRSLRHRPTFGPVFLLACCWTVTFGLTNPEGFVASGNLDRAGNADVDVAYLTNWLGADAVPVLVDRMDTLDPTDASQLGRDLCRWSLDANDAGPFGWNRSIAEAEQAVDRLNCQTLNP